MALIYPILRPLKIDFKKKAILFSLFSLGLLSIMCNVAKAVVFLEKPFTRGYIWAITEITVAIICASIPMLRPLFYKSAWVKGSGSAQRVSNLVLRGQGSNFSLPSRYAIDLPPAKIRPDSKQSKLTARMEYHDLSNTNLLGPRPYSSNGKEWY